MPNCKPGDLAEVIDPSSKGSLVYVEERYTLAPPDICCWVCECLSPVYARDVHTGDCRWVGPGKQVFINDKLLRPLPPLPEEETPDPVQAPLENNHVEA